MMSELTEIEALLRSHGMLTGAQRGVFISGCRCGAEWTAADTFGNADQFRSHLAAELLTARLAKVEALADELTLDHATHGCSWRTLDHDSPECPCSLTSAEALAEWLRAALSGDPGPDAPRWCYCTEIRADDLTGPEPHTCSSCGNTIKPTGEGV